MAKILKKKKLKRVLTASFAASALPVRSQNWLSLLSSIRRRRHDAQRGATIARDNLSRQPKAYKSIRYRL